MTDLITRPVEEKRRDDPVAGIRTATKGKIIALAVVIGILTGWAVLTNVEPGRAELEQVRRQQVVDYFENRYQEMADAQAAREAAYWQEVVNHYARQYELFANASSDSEVERKSAHWEAVVDYYGQQWELRGQ